MPASAIPDTAAMCYEVVVCTLDGEAYLEQQLDSILNQSPAPVRVIVSDDGSTDATRAIVDRLAQATDIPVRFIRGPGRGVIRNALFALTRTAAPYVLLADQDDIWLEHKARLFCERMKQTSAPHLIFSDAWVWHPETNRRVSFWQLDGLVPEHSANPQRLAFHNTVQGASLGLNRALIDSIRSHPNIAMHDWWLGLIAAGLGEVSIIRQPTLLYRQHAGNQIGSQKHRARNSVGIGQLPAKFQAARVVLEQARAFADLYADQLTDRSRDFFIGYCDAVGSGPLKRLWFLLKWRPVRKDARGTFTLWMSILLLRCPITVPDS